MQCTEFIVYCEQWLEGDRQPAAAAHLKECARCRRFVAEMEAIVLEAGNLAAETPEPPERVWAALRAQLETEGLIRARGFGEWFADLFAVLPRPALAGAYLGVLLGAILLGSLPTTLVQEANILERPPSPAVTLQPQYAQAEQKEVVALHTHDPAVAATYRDNLQVVDKFIALCEKTVREEPRNQMAREYLYSAYQQKAELLASMTDRGAGGDE